MAGITVVHGSDLHFGEPHHPEMAEAFLACAHDASPDVIVLSGDLTQRAKVGEYEEARAFLARLPGVPVVVTPGNHDVPLYRILERLFAPYRNYRAHIQEDLNTVTRIPGLTVVALNSSDPHRSIVNGRIHDWQIRFARDAFAASPEGDVRALVAHHHLAPAPDYEGDRPLPRARQVLEALEEMEVELVLGGHLHRAYIGNSLDVYPGQDRSHGVVIIQSGTTTSRRGRAREREKNSFNVIEIRSTKLQVTHHMYFDEAAGFMPLSIHAFPRRPNRWFGGRQGGVRETGSGADHDSY